jgi:hypothetical protein
MTPTKRITDKLRAAANEPSNCEPSNAPRIESITSAALQGAPKHQLKPSQNLPCPSPLIAGYGAFTHTETWLGLSLVKGARCQSLHRARNVIPASRAMRSSSEGHT